MSATDVTYPPIDTLKPVAPDIWIVDSGPHRMLGLPLPVRMTVVRLAGGDLWLHSPTRAAPALVEALRALGRVRHLVAPSVVHWTYLGEWQRRFPEAETWAVPALHRRRSVERQVEDGALRLDHRLDDRAPPAWEGQIEQAIVPGGLGFEEAVFLHRASDSLILTDLIQNFEAEKLPQPLPQVARLIGVDGRAPVYLRAIVAMRRGAAARALRPLLDRHPRRTIFSHGLWFEEDGEARARRSLAWLLEGRQADRRG